MARPVGCARWTDGSAARGQILGMGKGLKPYYVRLTLRITISHYGFVKPIKLSEISDYDQVQDH